MQNNNDLETYVAKRIDTTMIGALSDIEKYLPNIDVNAYNMIRKSILDRGNREKVLAQKEFSKYNVTYKWYKYAFPLKPLN